jgi:integrase
VDCYDGNSRRRGYSSAGRALAWHARGQGFESPYLHQLKINEYRDFRGKPLRKSVSAKTRAEVVRRLKDLQRTIDDGIPAPDSTVTVRTLLERWHDDVLAHHVSPSAAKNYVSIARNHIIPALGRKRLKDLTTSDVDRLISLKMKEGLATSSVSRIRSVLAQALDQGMRWGWVTRNVATLARPPKIDRPEGRTLTTDEARVSLKALEGHRNQALYTLMLATGLRRGEALGLRWTDFDSKRAVLNVRRQLTRTDRGLEVKDTKTRGSRRAINLPEQLTRLLAIHWRQQIADLRHIGDAWSDSGFMFTTTIGTPIDPRNLHTDFKKICLHAGLGDWHLHELRHSAASLMLAQRVKLQVVSEVLGQSSIRMTADVYGHILDPDRQSAARAIAGALWGDNH